MTDARISPNIFRAYDIRGIVNEGLNESVMYLLGKAIASEALDQDLTTLITGHDARLSSKAFHKALITGILETGCHVTDLGLVSSPMLYFATHTLKATSGIMITGSHNPAEYNGLKIVFNRQCLSDNQIDSFRKRIEANQFHEGQGQYAKLDIASSYIERINRDLQLAGPLKVVVDAGNGVAGVIAPELFRTFAFEVIPLYCEPDGHFPNHHPDPTVATNLTDLIALVKKEKADLGIALDGDGDRVSIVSSSGRIFDADKLLMSFVLDILPDHPLATIVFDVKSSAHLPRLIKAHGGNPVMCKSGHSFVKKTMHEAGALLGGEYSAHLFFRHRWFGFDDGMYCAARFMELMQKYSASADELYDRLPASISTPELGIAIAEEDKFKVMTLLAEQLDFPDAHITTIDGVRADFSTGWGLIRASNTTPKLVMRFEADTEADLKEIQQIFRIQFLRVVPHMELPF